MYNRYVPQSDGSYCRTRLPDCPPRQATAVQQQKKLPMNAEPEVSENAQKKPTSIPCQKPSGIAKNTQRKTTPHTPACSSIGSFLKQILPPNFDTADLIVVLLLLLISGDNTEDQNNALLTLALYLFM